MTNRFMMSVAAAALIAGTGFAYAQGTGGGTSQGGAASQSAPSSERSSPSAAPMNRDSGGAAATKGAESNEGAKGGMNNAQSKEGMGKDRMNSAQSKDGMSKDGMKDAQSKEGMSKDGMAKDRNAQSKEGMSKDGMKDAQTKDGMSKEGNTAAKDSKSGTTTGNAATSATAAPPAEKRTQITSAIRQEKVEETTNVNFNISVGTAVPSSVRFHPLPSRIVEIYPEWRGYDFILVHGRYIIIRPQTHEIVYIIEG
jgi:Protein of unknown function (DUF1236)